MQDVVLPTPPFWLEKEIILTAILYNLNAGEEAMKQLADSAMGFNQSVGGPTIWDI